MYCWELEQLEEEEAREYCPRHIRLPNYRPLENEKKEQNLTIKEGFSGYLGLPNYRPLKIKNNNQILKLIYPISFTAINLLLAVNLKSINKIQNIGEKKYATKT